MEFLGRLVRDFNFWGTVDPKFGLNLLLLEAWKAVSFLLVKVMAFC